MGQLEKLTNKSEENTAQPRQGEKILRQVLSKLQEEPKSIDDNEFSHPKRIRRETNPNERNSDQKTCI